MALDNLTQLLRDAALIRDAQQDGFNTAERVGSILQDIINDTDTAVEKAQTDASNALDTAEEALSTAKEAKQTAQPSGTASGECVTTATLNAAIAGLLSSVKVSYNNSTRVLKITDSNGADSAATLPFATATVAGLVSTAAQTLAGKKTFSDGISIPTLVISGSLTDITLTAQQYTEEDGDVAKESTIASLDNTLAPSKSSSYSLGTSTLRWKTVVADTLGDSDTAVQADSVQADSITAESSLSVAGALTFEGLNKSLVDFDGAQEDTTLSIDDVGCVYVSEQGKRQFNLSCDEQPTEESYNLLTSGALYSVLYSGTCSPEFDRPIVDGLQVNDEAEIRQLSLNGADISFDQSEGVLTISFGGKTAKITLE